MTLPPVTDAGGLNNAAIANSIVDFPQPDSPTTPTNSPLPTVRSTLSTAQTEPRDVLYSTFRPVTSRMGALDTRPPDRPQRRVADLVECVVEQCERGAEQRPTNARGDSPDGISTLQRA